MHGEADNPDDGLQVAAEGSVLAPLQAAPAGVVAFVGRTLRGPVARPVAVRTFAEFERIFGGLWQPAPLGHAVAQFFANGGVEALVVRVVNRARSATLRLPEEGGRGGWRLTARQPGTREFLRAAVDHDGLGPTDTDEFNLLLQRVRAADSDVVMAQESYPRASCTPGTPRFLPDLLAGSALATVEAAAATAPPGRPAVTPARQWWSSSPDGDDGLAPTEHDLIGDAAQGTGLQALAGSTFHWLVLPPPARGRSLGPLVWWVAARFCGERRAMLLVDPPDTWHDPATALRELADWPLRSPDAAMFFPGIRTLDPLRGEVAGFPPSGAVAGLLSRQESRHSPALASSARLALPPLRPGFSLAVAVTPAERARLGGLGVNVPPTIRAPRGVVPPQVTLAGPGARGAVAGQLLWRRRWQTLLSTLLEGTRWTLFHHGPPSPTLWRPLARQAGDWLASQADVAAAAGGGWFVVCDQRLNPPESPPRTVRFLFGFLAEGEWQATLVTQSPAGAGGRPVSPNPWVLPLGAPLPDSWPQAEPQAKPEAEPDAGLESRAVPGFARGVVARG